MVAWRIDTGTINYCHYTTGKSLLLPNLTSIAMCEAMKAKT
jgi:hypothetical protein